MHKNNGYANVPRCYIYRTLPALLDLSVTHTVLRSALFYSPYSLITPFQRLRGIYYKMFWTKRFLIGWVVTSVSELQVPSFFRIEIIL